MMEKHGEKPQNSWSQWAVGSNHSDPAFYHGLLAPADVLMTGICVISSFSTCLGIRVHVNPNEDTPGPF